MSQKSIVFLWLFVFVACTKPDNSQNPEMLRAAEVPQAINTQLIKPHQLVHRGIYANDLNSYYFTVSDTTFSNFDVFASQLENGRWTPPERAFFNSEYDDHGMSFSPDGNVLVFSSTRPTGKPNMPATWHLWQSRKSGQNWEAPELIEIPNLEDKLVSHPTLAPDGTLYFHASELDYTDMAVHFAKKTDEGYGDAQKLEFPGLETKSTCTPYLSSDGKFLFFATVGESLDLYFATSLGGNAWTTPKKLPGDIFKDSQGNPYLTPDSQRLLYAANSRKTTLRWEIRAVNPKDFITQ